MSGYRNINVEKMERFGIPVSVARQVLNLFDASDEMEFTVDQIMSLIVDFEHELISDGYYTADEAIVGDGPRGVLRFEELEVQSWPTLEDVVLVKTTRRLQDALWERNLRWQTAVIVANAVAGTPQSPITWTQGVWHGDNEALDMLAERIRDAIEWATKYATRPTTRLWEKGADSARH